MSDSESDSDSSSSEEEVKVVPQVVLAKEESDSDSDSDSSSEVVEKPKPAAKKKKKKAKAKKVKKVKKKAVKVVAKVEESDSDSDSSDDEEEKKPVAAPVVVDKEDSDSSDSDSSDDEEEEKKPVAKPVVKAVEKADESDSDSDSDSDDEDDKKEAAKAVVEKKADASSDSSDDEGDSSDADDEAEEKPVEKMEVEKKEETPEVDFTKSLEKKVTITPVFAWNVSEPRGKGKKRKLESASTPVVAKKAKVETAAPAKAAAPAADAPVANPDMKPTKDFYATDYQNSHLKGTTSTVFIKGIDINAFEADITEFFTDIEKPAQVRHKWFEDRPGIAFIQFSSPEVATKCVIDKNNEYIKSRYINTDWSEERKQSVNTRGPRNAHLKDTTLRVWVGNLHREVQEENVIEYFSSVGILTDVYIIGRDETRPKIAYISFESNELATKAVETLSGGSLMDYTVRLDWAEPRQNNAGGNKRKRELTEKPDGCVTCFVGRLSDDVDDEKLKELFKDAGEISQIRYLERDGEFKGSAFIEFAETESTDKAVLLNGSSFLNRQIRVDFAESSNKKKREEW